MKLQELFDHLAYGELSQLSIGGQNAGSIDETNYTRVVNHINLALTAVYTRFSLKTKTISFALQPDAETYQLNLSDLLKIEKVSTVGGVDLPLNDNNNVYSCITPTLRSLKVSPLVLAQGMDLPDVYKTTDIIVTYRANHPKLSSIYGVELAGLTTIELPESHLEPVLYYIASRVQSPVGMKQDMALGMTYAARYEASCQVLEGKGVQVDQGGTNNRLERNGWA